MGFPGVSSGKEPACQCKKDIEDTSSILLYHMIWGWRESTLKFHSLPRKRPVLSLVWLYVVPWTETHQTPQSMTFSRQEYWSGLPFSTLGNFPHPGVELESLVFPALAAGSSPLAPLALYKKSMWFNVIEKLHVQYFSSTKDCCH